jgi:hypothetical protein
MFEFYHVVEERASGRLQHGPGTLNVNERIDKHLDGVLVASHHKIGEADVVACGDDARWHASDQQLLFFLEIF